MERAVVLNFLAMELSVSPRWTLYVRKVGPGLGVGRAKVGVTDGPAAVADGTSVVGRAAVSFVAVGEPNMAGPTNSVPTSPSTTTTSSAASHGESRAVV